MGIDQLKDRESKFSGAHLYPDGSTNSRSSFSQVGENGAADILGKRIQSVESSAPVDRNFSTCPLQRNPARCSDYARVLLTTAKYNAVLTLNDFRL